MDELDLIRSFRQDDAVPDPNARAAARDRLLAHKAAAEHPRRRPARRRRARWQLGALGAAAAAVITLAVLPGVDRGPLAPAPATAAEALQQVAAVAERRGRVPLLRPGEYFYTRSRQELPVQAAGFTVVSITQDEVWLDREGTGRRVSRPVGMRFPTARDRRRWRAAGAPQLATSFDQPLPERERGRLLDPHRRGFRIAGRADLTYTEIVRLPTDPDALYRRLRREVGTRSGPSVDEAVFTAIANLLSATPAPDRLRAALYRALAGVHGSHLLGPARDDIGRPGVAVAFDESWWRTTLIFDPATSELLGTRATVTRVPRPGPGRSTAPVGTTLASTTYLQTGVVRSTRDRP